MTFNLQLSKGFSTAAAVSLEADKEVEDAAPVVANRQAFDGAKSVPTKPGSS